MKYKGCTTYLAEDRNEDLLRAYYRVIRRGGTSAIKDVYKLLETEPASRFWVTGERAYEFIIKKHKGIVCKNSRSKIYTEIEKRAQEYMKENGGSFRKACKAVVLQPAPSFYLETTTMENIIRDMQSRKNKKKR